MHRNENPDRITEFTMYGDRDGEENVFVGDSQTARAIEELDRRLTTGLKKVEQRVEHVVRHLPTIDPTPGCIYCEVGDAA
jgi:hypothetical protein